MKMTTLKKLLTGFFLAAFILFLALFNGMKPRILVLHSFAQDDPWPIRVNAGINRVLRENRNPVNVKHHYLDVIKNRRTDTLQLAVNEALQAIERQKPDIVIAFDDEANEMVASRYAGKGKPRILFASTLQPPERYGYAGAANVSGVMEKLPLDAIRDAIHITLKGKPARIAVVAMDDETCRAELAQVQSYNWAPHRITAVQAKNSFPEWREFISGLAERADVLLVLSYGGLEKGSGSREEVPGTELVSWIEKNSKPLPISICPAYAEDGGGLEVAPSPSDFGLLGMNMALKWVEAGKGAPPPSIQSSHHFRIGMRKSLLEARGIIMPPIYVEAARTAEAWYP